MDLPYYNLGRYGRERFGGPLRKIVVDGGFSCPNRDGSLGTDGCRFCSVSSFRSPTRSPRRTVRDQVAAARTRMRGKEPAARFCVYFQSHSNTYGPAERLRAVYEEALQDGVVVLALEITDLATAWVR